MKSILLDKTLRDRLVAKGLKQVTRFSWRTAAERVLDAYKAVAAAERVGRTAKSATFPSS